MAVRSIVNKIAGKIKNRYNDKRYSFKYSKLLKQFNNSYPVVVSLASFPQRIGSLKKVIKIILPQVDKINIYLNEYTYVPAFLKDSKINVFLGRDYEDLKDNGKFFFTDNLTNCYHFTIDDDIAYPYDYIKRIIFKLQEYDNKAVVGVHGAIFHEEIKSYLRDRRVFHFSYRLEQDILVNLLGTGTIGYHTSAVKIKLSDFGTKGMADVWFAIYCKNNNIPLISTSREHRWLRPIKNEYFALFHKYINDDSVQTNIVNSHRPWNLDNFGDLKYSNLRLGRNFIDS